MNKVYTWILLLIIALAGLVVFGSAYDCIVHWINGTSPDWFEKSSFWYLILSIPMIYLGIKFSSMKDPEDKK
jgi:uncharacterized membrane protein YhdT